MESTVRAEKAYTFKFKQRLSSGQKQSLFRDEPSYAVITEVKSKGKSNQKATCLLDKIGRREDLSRSRTPK